MMKVGMLMSHHLVRIFLPTNHAVAKPRGYLAAGDERDSSIPPILTGRWRLDARQHRTNRPGRSTTYGKTLKMLQRPSELSMATDDVRKKAEKKKDRRLVLSLDLF